MHRELRAVAATASVSHPSQEVEEQAEKYLTFRVGGDAFAVPFGRVREIMGIQEITCVAGSAVFVKGVINLRGKIVPVVDLRLKLGLPEREYKLRTCIVVTQIGKLTMGIIVDSVAEVLVLRASDIQNGAAKVKGKVKTLLNLDVLLSAEEMQALAAVSV